jgi:HEPN domain-containing protein
LRNDDSAKAFLDDADIIVSETAISLERGHYHRVMRKCQEAAELSVKGLFKYAGIEYPKSHILGRVLKKEVAEKGIYCLPRDICSTVSASQR